MIKISIPQNNLQERGYVLDFFFQDFLGLDYVVDSSILNLNYSIRFNDSELIIQDSFFQLYPEPLSYLQLEAIPKNIYYTVNEFAPEKNIPIIYGTPACIVEEKKILCGIDIFASSFFMLTRWEEYVNKTRDQHSRFPSFESIAFKNKFLNRPIVNEYVEMLWKMMLKLGFNGKPKNHNFELFLTSDIDKLIFPKSFSVLTADLLIRRNLSLFREHFNFMYFTNPYDTFEIFMGICEKMGKKAHFYFMASEKKNLPLDHRYILGRNITKSKIAQIKERGHIIGFHPGYFTYNNEEKWVSEKRLLENFIGCEVNEGRQHYLRMDITKTLSIWDNNNMKIDSTLGYYDNEGFRCGTGNIFPVFDILRRNQLNLLERPLIIMDVTLFKYKNYSIEQASEIMNYYFSISRKYRTNLTLLFHNDSIHSRWNGKCLIILKKLTSY